MSNPGADNAINQLARLILAARREALHLTGDMGDSGTDDETAVRFLPDFTEAGDVLQLIVNGDGDLVASWQEVAGVGSGGGRYRALIIELDGVGGFDFVIDTDGSPLDSLEELE